MPPQGLVLVKENKGSNDNIDSDITNFFGPGTSNPISISLGQNINNLSAGYYQMAEVGNLVWLDLNADGLQSEEEPKLGDVKVEAYNTKNEIISSDVTDENGIYNLDYLGQTEYYLKFYPPQGLTSTIYTEELGEINSDINHSHGLFTTGLISLTSGEKRMNVDAGFSYTALPVTWNKIIGENKGNFNMITWSTSNEINCEKYELEYLQNENEFVVINEIKALNKQNKNEYSLHHDQLDKYPSYVYRVKQYDFDGKYSYSDLVQIDRLLDNDIIFYPNPSNGMLSFEYSESHQETILEIIGLDGRIMYQNKISPLVDLSFLQNGSYMIKLTNDSSVIYKKIIIGK
jgi:hypothetical protein